MKPPLGLVAGEDGKRTQADDASLLISARRGALYHGMATRCGHHQDHPQQRPAGAYLPHAGLVLLLQCIGAPGGRPRPSCRGMRYRMKKPGAMQLDLAPVEGVEVWVG